MSSLHLLLLLQLVSLLGGLNLLLRQFSSVGLRRLQHLSSILSSSEIVELRRLLSVEHSLLRQDVVRNVGLGFDQSKVLGQVLDTVLLVIIVFFNKRVGITIDTTKDGGVSASSASSVHLVSGVVTLV